MLENDNKNKNKKNFENSLQYKNISDATLPSPAGLYTRLS